MEGCLAAVVYNCKHLVLLKWVCGGVLFALTSASLFRRRSMMSSASRREEAIIRGVHPEESWVIM